MNKKIKIGDKIIGGSSTFIIADIGSNHMQDISLAKESILAAVDSGVDAVKFQMRHIEEVYRSKSLSRQGDDLGTEYVLDLLDKFELTQAEHKELSNYCKENFQSFICYY